MKVNHNDKFLAKKVLLSVVAAGVMTGFVMNAEAADGKFLEANSKTITENNVSYNEVVAENSANVTLNGGKVSGWKENHQDDQEPDVAFADIAADVSNGSTLQATNVDFTGGIEASGRSKIILNGGSVTAGNFYDKAYKPLYSTEIGADGATIELNKVKIDSNLGAVDGSVLTVNDSNVNADAAIFASGKGAVINLNSTDGNATYTVGEDGIEAEDGAAININGGKVNTSYLVANANTTITVKNADVKATEIIDADGANTSNASITFDGTEKNVYTVDKGIVAENGGKIYIYGGTLKDDNLKSKMYGVKTEEGNTLNTDTKGIVLDKNGVISTMSDQIYANAASANQKESGAITNEGIDFKGGSQGGSVITVAGADANVKVVVGTDDHANPVAGATEIIGHLNIGNALATSNTQYNLNGEVIVNDASTLKTNGQVEVTDSITLVGGRLNAEKGSLNTDKLIVDKIGDLAGNVGAKKLELIPGSSLNSALNIGDDTGAGKLTVDEIKLNGGSILLDPVWREGTTISDASGLAVKNITTVDGKYIVGRNSVLSLGADLATAESVFAKTEQTWGENEISAAAYIASTINVRNGSLIVDGSRVDYPTTAVTNGSVNFADKSLLMVDGEKTKTTAAITGVTDATVADSSKLYIDNAKNGETYKIIAGSENGWKKENVISNNKLLKFNIEDSTTHDAYNVTADSDSVKEAYGSAIFAGDVYDAAILAGGAAAEFVNNASDDHNNADDAAKASALNSAAAMGELAGVEHGTYAASNLLTDAVTDHMSLANDKDHDSDIWAKYIHTKEDIDGLSVANFGADYDAQYNGIVVGADLYKNGKATVGAALTYVDGNINGNTLAARTKNDATYYGASIYGGIQNEDSAVICDISYLHGKNDITQRNSGTTLTADAKSDAFSIGVRAEKSLKAGVGKFVPYAGIRYMHLGTGNYNNSIGMSYDGDDMNLWLLPVGVKYSADVKAGSWTIRPIAEIGYVWNMGDRDATQTVSLNGASNGFGYDVADNGSYIGRFVVEAEKANVTYGLGYEYQKGDSVKANKWMANVNWSF